MPNPHDVHALLAAELGDPATGWSLGTFGAIAEFVRDPDEVAEIRTEPENLAAVTGRGGIRFESLEAVEPVAYETPSKHPHRWMQAVAFCLRGGEAEMNRRTVLTELGPDDAALREADRAGVLFDIGLGTLQVEVCIRTADAALIAVLRAAAGRSLFAPGNTAMTAIVAAGPHRVFLSRLGRCEVYQPIPPADGRSPEGPHTHILPKLLRSGRTHAATTPIPDGLVPCAQLYLPEALAQERDGARSGRQQSLLQRFGDPDLVALKEQVAVAVGVGGVPGAFVLSESRFARPAVRVALRQLSARQPHLAALPQWLAHFDRPGTEGDDAEDEHGGA